MLLATLAFTVLNGRVLGVSRGLALLIGVGTSICGASAVLAAKVATAGDDEDASLCGRLRDRVARWRCSPIPPQRVFWVPAARLWAVGWLVDPRNRAAVAASFQGGGDAGQFGTIAKRLALR